MVEYRASELAITLTRRGLLGALSGFHCRPKSILRLRIPISAVQFEKHGCIWNSHVGFDYEHSEQLASAIKLRDDLFVWKSTLLRLLREACRAFLDRNGCPERLPHEQRLILHLYKCWV